MERRRSRVRRKLISRERQRRVPVVWILRPGFRGVTRHESFRAAAGRTNMALFAFSRFLAKGELSQNSKELPPPVHFWGSADGTFSAADGGRAIRPFAFPRLAIKVQSPQNAKELHAPLHFGRRRMGGFGRRISAG